MQPYSVLHLLEVPSPKGSKLIEILNSPEIDNQNILKPNETQSKQRRSLTDSTYTVCVEVIQIQTTDKYNKEIKIISNYT